jgi:hypothetical protein
VGIDVLFEGFTGTVQREYDGVAERVVDIFSDESAGGGIRTIPKEFVSDIEEKDSAIEFNGISYTIRCKDCGEAREVKPQHISQVKRCRKCQRKHDKETAKTRSLRRRGKL